MPTPSLLLALAAALPIVGALACTDVRAAPVEAVAPGQAAAVFAGGCFWCVEADFEKLDGVISATSGYTGGPEKNPTYEQVSGGRTGHTEAVRVVYDPNKVSYQKLVDWFFKHIDPTQKDGQFCDHGRQYRSAVFYGNEAERKIVEATVASYLKEGSLRASPGSKIVTEIVPAGEFWPAEGYHQDYYRKNPGVYQRYRIGCGRDARVQELWGAGASRSPAP
jgi:peptide-methionine (S)-S-oxide reductase